MNPRDRIRFLVPAILLLARAALAVPADDAILKRIPIRRASTPLALVGDYLFVAASNEDDDRTLDLAPALYRIDTTSLQVSRQPLVRPIYQFRREGGKLLALHYPMALATFDLSIELPADSNDAKGRRDGAGRWLDRASAEPVTVYRQRLRLRR